MLFLLFSGARKGEAVNLKWCNFNFKNDSVTIRETKSGRPLCVPVARYVMDESRQYKIDFRKVSHTSAQPLNFEPERRFPCSR